MTEEFFESPSRLSEARDIIQTARETIERGVLGSHRSWLECFSMTVSQIESRLYDPRAERELGRETYERALDQLRDVRTELDGLQREHAKEELSDIRKDELLKKLDIFA